MVPIPVTRYTCAAFGWLPAKEVTGPASLDPYPPWRATLIPYIFWLQ